MLKGIYVNMTPKYLTMFSVALLKIAWKKIHIDVQQQIVNYKNRILYNHLENMKSWNFK